MTEPSPWAWAQQLPALGMILTFLWFAGKHGGRALFDTLKTIQDNCHSTMRQGHEVIKEATTAIGESTESNHQVQALLV